MSNEVPDWVHDRFQRIEDVQRETLQQLAVNTATVKAFGEQMKSVVDLFLEKLESANEISIAAIQNVKEDQKALSQRVSKSDEDIKLLKTGEHHRAKWTDWVRSIIQQVVIIVVTALATLYFGKK